jgi:protein SCO1/2
LGVTIQGLSDRANVADDWIEWVMWKKVALVAAGILAGPLLAIYLFVFLEPVQVLPKIGPAPGYQLIDQDGGSVASESLRGSLTLYTFAYSRCSGTCAEAVQRQREVQTQIDAQSLGLPVRLVTVSIDTEHDTPERLKQWSTDVGADPATWSFVTGDAQSIRRLVAVGYDTFYTRANDGTWTMDTRMVLVDGWGVIRAQYGTQDYLPSTERLVSDLSLVAEEALAMDGPARLAYDAAQLFGCYP